MFNMGQAFSGYYFNLFNTFQGSRYYTLLMYEITEA